MADQVVAAENQASRDQERSAEVSQDASSSIPGVPESEVKVRKGKGREGRDKKRRFGGRDTPPNSERPKKPKPDSLAATRRFACPFFIHDPDGHPKCGRTFRPRSMADVRQHVLRTAHQQPLHCPSCKQIFDGRDELNCRRQRREHISQRTCIHRDIKIPGITEDQVLQIMYAQNRSDSQIYNWFMLWGLLFPSAVPPDSPYITPSEPEDLAQPLAHLRFKDPRASSPSFDDSKQVRVLMDAFARFTHDKNADEGMDRPAPTHPIPPASSPSLTGPELEERLGGTPFQQIPLNELWTEFPPRVPLTFEASIGELHSARANTSNGDDLGDSDDNSSNEDRYARSFIFSPGVSASSETSHSSSGHAKPAREIIADLLMNDDELRALLAAGAADTNIGIERLSKNLGTLLKMYSEELLQLADTTDLKEAGKLVGNSSLYVSNRIRAQFGQPSQSSPLEDPGRLLKEEERSPKEERLNQYLKSSNGADQLGLDDSLPGADIEDADEDWDDEEAITSALEQVKSFLRNGAPFENLRQRLKSFVTPASSAGDQPIDEGMVKIQASSDGFIQTLPILIDSLFEHLADLLPESPVHEGKVRARWTCRCGVRLFDDFTELEPGSVKDLENHLRELNSGTPGTQQLARTVFKSVKDLSIRVQNVFRRMRRATRTQGTTLPLQNVVSQSVGTRPQGQKSLHILFCIEKENLGTRLHQACVENINTDRETFELLREEYQARRTTTSWLTLRSIKKLSLSRFLIDSSNLADVHWHLDICRVGCVCLPPLPLVLQKKYACRPAPEVPQKHEPAIGPNRLKHCFLNPECLNLNQRSIYNQLPKRVGKPLSVSHLEEELGWGVHFEEGWHHTTIYLISVILLVFSSLVFGITWAVTEGDIQGAFAISCFLTSLGGILVGYLAIKSQ